MRNAKKLGEVSMQLKELLQGLETQRHSLSMNLEHFSKVAENAVNGLPSIEKKVQELTRNFGEAINKSNDEINEHLKQSVDRAEKQISALDKAMSEELTKALETFGKQLAALSEKFVSDYTPLTESLQKVVNVARGIQR